jgi:hypothetical protein
MAQPGRGAGLAQGPLLSGVAVAGGQFVRQLDLLDRDIPVEHLVVGHPDPPHAAGTERLAQPIPSGDRYRRGSHAR